MEAVREEPAGLTLQKGTSGQTNVRPAYPPSRDLAYGVLAFSKASCFSWPGALLSAWRFLETKKGLVPWGWHALTTQPPCPPQGFLSARQPGRQAEPSHQAPRLASHPRGPFVSPHEQVTVRVRGAHPRLSFTHSVGTVGEARFNNTAGWGWGAWGRDGNDRALLCKCQLKAISLEVKSGIGPFFFFP